MSLKLSKLLHAAQRHAFSLLAGYTLLLLIGTHLPQELIGEPESTGSDKVFHFFAYGVLALLVALALHRRTAEVRWPAMLPVLLVVMAVAAADELTQPLPWFNRTCDPMDWVADTLGGVAAIVWYLRARHTGAVTPLAAEPAA